ncbi:hypothetical protein EYF80_027412 [Liparis tanakae]|uniref:Uncharacterized protein n=1 Tax=Liparis tanakae TaxID=230148 RepID=A0A4Z2H9W4_9TELE|nr:hypothetical protein EYF80_027412 [Liparis tanakae]
MLEGAHGHSSYYARERRDGREKGEGSDVNNSRFREDNALGVMKMMRVTVKGAPSLLVWCYTTLRKTLMEAEHYAEGFGTDNSSLLLTVPEPRPSNQHPVHQEHGKIGDDYEHESTVN